MATVAGHEAWRAKYRERRYMRHLKIGDLEQRTRDVLGNMSILSEKGQISLHEIGPEGLAWMILWTHVLEEYELREAGMRSDILVGAQMPRPTYPAPPRSQLALGSSPLPPTPYWLKLGERRFVEAAWVEGAIRINPAAGFKDPSLNPAIADDELAVQINRLPEDLDPPTLALLSKAASPISRHEFLDISVRSRTDYYVYCMASSYELRLFDDFNYDACLVIREPNVFAERLRLAVGAVLPEWDFAASPVEYIDPLNHRGPLPDVFFSKHFRYSYQREFRFGWIPRSPVSSLEPLDVKVGPLHDICDVIALQST